MIPFKLYEPMKAHLSFNCGGSAKFYYEPRNLQELLNAINYCKKIKRKYFILGNGTNVLCSDDGYSGAVICTKKLQNILLTKYLGSVIICLEAGVSLFKLNKLLSDLGIEGLEWSYGIPGTIGGAVYMNAGAYGHEIFEFVEQVEVLYRGKVKKLKKEQIKFSYRNGGLKNAVILKVFLKFWSNCCSGIKEKQNFFMKMRIQNQPLNFPSAGSVFKRKGEIIPAEIIDKLGLKGAIIGGAKVSEKHAGFIVNYNSATTTDVLKLIEKVESEVYNKTGIKLEREIVLLK